MPIWLFIVVAAIVFSVGATWVSRRLLDDRIGWVLPLVTAAAVFFLSAPVAIWALKAADVISPDDRIVVTATIAVAFFALTGGWIFALVGLAIVTLEFLWPSRRLVNPVVAIREGLRRRDRARRYAQILAIASRHGLGLFQGRRHGIDRDDLPRALVGALNEAGVTFVKLGQVLSSREDVLPVEFIRALSTLQMDSTPVPWAEARAAIETQLGRPIPEVFASVDEKPLAAASVAQVHTATLLTGEAVVVKIQRPKARAQVSTDLDILERLATDLERRADWARDYGAHALVVEFARSLREELDYRVEAANTEMLRGALVASGTRRMRVPEIHADLTTAQMLVQERVEGAPFSRLAPETVPADARAIADDVVDSVFDQIALRGVFHADLHAGNLILGADGSVALIDFGSIGVVEKSLRRLLVPLLVAIGNEDDLGATDVLLMMCGAPEDLDTGALQHDVGVILTRVRNSRVDQNIFGALVDVIRRHRLAMPPSLLLVFRTLASLEGTLRRLVPDYNMVGHGLSSAPRMALDMITPRDAALTSQTELALTVQRVRRLPRRVEKVTRSLEDGTFSVRLRGFESIADRAWIDGIIAQLLTTLTGLALIVTGIVLAVDDGGPELTDDVSGFGFLGSTVCLGGSLLLLRGLRRTFLARGTRSS